MSSNKAKANLVSNERLADAKAALVKVEAKAKRLREAIATFLLDQQDRGSSDVSTNKGVFGQNEELLGKKELLGKAVSRHRKARAVSPGLFIFRFGLPLTSRFWRP